MTTGIATGRSRAVERLLYAGWWFLMALLPIGHLTGLRNTTSVVVVFGTLLWLGRDAWTRVPAWKPAVALIAWCAMSVAWSAAPQTSFAKWQVDLLLPLLGALAAFGYVRRTGRIDALVGGVATGIVCLAVLSITAVLPGSLASHVGSLVRTDSFATVTNPMPVWFPGVGDASMAVALATIGLLLAARVLPAMSRVALRVVGVVFAASIVFILFAINNRNAILTIPIGMIVAIWLARRRVSSGSTEDRQGFAQRRVVIAGLLVGLAVGSAAMLEWGARQRMQQMGVTVADDQSGLVRLTERDTRPMIWSYYTGLARHAPWIGVGFGRTVPGLAYGTQKDTDLASIEANAYSHAHNILLNWWLQTGVVGVALLLAVLAAVVQAAWRAMGEAGTPRRAAASTVVALVVTMLLRNMTDDFLVFGMATMFWVLVGGFIALAVRPQDAGIDQREP